MDGQKRWYEDKLAFARMLRLMGHHGAALKRAMTIMETREVLAEKELTDKPVPCQLREPTGPEIDHAWIEGATCSEPFVCLSPYERFVLYLMYHEDVDVILKLLDMPKATYYKVIAKIREKIANASGLR